MITGWAKLEETASYLKKHGWSEGTIRKNPMFVISPIGLGNHLGSVEDVDSEAYVEATKYALENGMNVLDTAINYRGMRSEKDLGRGILEAMENGIVTRDEFMVSTKAGLLFGDITKKLRPALFLEQILAPKGITEEMFQTLDGGLYHTLNPAFFEEALSISLQNLGIETVDVHYIHIPEISRIKLGETEFYRQLKELFAWYEEKVAEKKIRYYGLALEIMVFEDDEEAIISLEKVCKIAEEVAGEKHHFRFIQLPYSKYMQNARVKELQLVAGEQCSIMEAAKRLGLQVMGSMPFAMGKYFDKWSAEQMLTFCLEEKDIGATICGSKNIEHIKAHIKTAKEKR